MFVPQCLFSIGGYFQGAPGSGKTYSLYSLISDMQQPIKSKHASFVSVDLKHDAETTELFQKLRAAAEQSDVSEDNPNQD